MANNVKEQWLTSLRVEKRASANTLDAYRRDLEIFIVSDTSIQEALSERSLRAAIAAMSHGGKSAKSIARSMSALRSFTRWAIKQGVLANDFSLPPIKLPRIRKTLPKVIDVDVAQQIVEVRGREDKLLRDAAIFELFYSSGLRLAELRNVKLNDLDLDAYTVTVKGKGNKERIVPFGRHAGSALKKWLSVNNFDNAHPVFINISTKRQLSARGIQYIVEKRGLELDLQQKLHPHLFRHACASHLLESSGDLRAVQELLGHENISTTQVYTHLNFQHLSDVYDKAHPRAKKTK